MVVTGTQCGFTLKEVRLTSPLSSSGRPSEGSVRALRVSTLKRHLEHLPKYTCGKAGAGVGRGSSSHTLGESLAGQRRRIDSWIDSSLEGRLQPRLGLRPSC